MKIEFTPSKKSHTKHASELADFRPWRGAKTDDLMFAREVLQEAGVDIEGRECSIWRSEASGRYIAICPTYKTRTNPMYTFVKLGARTAE